ncbi:TonB-dependent receptor [Phenylobacterium sp.]|uniref:TonB-dependent receptor n=1 Tax=Phenylobacterium sp. TaxID=1871053 RepID=UPI003BA85D29
MRLYGYLASASTLALVLTAAAPARAADANAADGDAGPALEELLVTAQKRSENLQDTPIAISVLTSQGLEDRNVYSLVDLGDGAIPSLKVAPFFSRPGALIMNVRGIGVLSDSNQPARDQGVGIYVDGVYLGRPQGLGTALYDVESIEVLKGPQGTLFGRNTEGGAVSITTKRPTGEFGLMAKAGVSNFAGYVGEMHLDLPRVANISVKLDGVVTARDGWVKNPLATAEDFGGYDKRALRARLLWEPVANFTADYAYDAAYDATTTLYQQFLAASTYPTALAPAAGNTASTKRIRNATFGVPQRESIGRTEGHRLTLDWKLSDHALVKSITSYRDLTQSQWDNGSVAQSAGVFRTGATFLNQDYGRYSLAYFKQQQSSEEVQLIGDLPRIKYVLGALYYRERVSDNARAFATNTFTDAVGVNGVPRAIDPLTQRIDRASEVTTKSYGAFGQATYTPPLLDDALHITAGGRFTRDEKKGRMRTINNVNFPLGSAGRIIGGLTSPNPLDESWERFDPILNVAFDVSEDILVYGKYSTGYKSGGANSRSLRYAPFDPETVAMFEAGAKAEFMDRRVRVNVSAYDGRYKDIQLDFSAQYLQTDPVTGALLQTQRTTTETTNAPGKGKLRGFEADVAFAVTDELTVSGSYAYNKVKIPDTLNPFPQANGRIITVPIPIYQVYTPENAASFSIDYSRPAFGEARFVAHLDGNYGDGYYANYTDVAYDPVTRAVTIRQPKGDSSFLVNARLSIADLPTGPGRTTVSIWSRNLLNQEHVFAKFLSDRTGLGGFFNEPRTFGLEVSMKM